MSSLKIVKESCDIGSFKFKGGDGNDLLELYSNSFQKTVNANFGAGDDKLSLGAWADGFVVGGNQFSGKARFNGGKGTDTIVDYLNSTGTPPLFKGFET